MALKKLIPDATEPANFGKPYGTILIRLFAGACMFGAGIEKATNQWWATSHAAFSAAGFLKNSAGGGAFHAWFVSLAAPSAIGTVNLLVVAGEVLIGLAFVLGVFVRFAAIMGTIEVGLIWITEYHPGTGTFYMGWSTGPLELGAALICMFIVSSLIGGGLIYGLDSKIYQLNFIKKHPKLKILLG